MLTAQARDRILLLDGGMGTMIQEQGLSESEFRGDEFEGHPKDLTGNNDLLNLTQPGLISQIHLKYFEAGSDICTTNTFNGTSISQEEYGLSHQASRMTKAGALAARDAVRIFSSLHPDLPQRLVAGSVGPTSVTLSVSPSVEDAAARNCDFDSLVGAYKECMSALVEGGVDVLLLETIFDTLNAKAGVVAYIELGRPLPLMISGTVVDKSGRTLSGQTIDAFVISLNHAKPVSFGINCGLGAAEMSEFIERLAMITPHTLVSCYPNAGLPNELGGYDETPEEFAASVSIFARRGLVNAVGGCCGTSPAFIRALKEATASCAPRIVAEEDPYRVKLHLSGLEPFRLDASMNLVNIGERCNVAGSLRFKRLIKSKDFDKAIGVAREQVESGAQMLDFNFDDGLIDGVEVMSRWSRMVASDPDICAVPFVVDSSKIQVIREGLRWFQGKCLVNSISLKEGEEAFLSAARVCQSFGAAVIVMAFDELGQADSTARRVSICTRAYRLLTSSGFPGCDIVFDCNILTIATGMPEHNHQAVSFMEAVEQLRVVCPHAAFSGGLSNLSFAFRGLNYLREAMHSVFLYHAVRKGLNLAIVNAGALVPLGDVEEDLRLLLEDVVLNTRTDAVDDLISRADLMRQAGEGPAKVVDVQAWRSTCPRERLQTSLLKGVDEFIETDITEVLGEVGDPLAVIQGPLMQAMGVIGERFGSGKMFLPQVIKSARVLKKAFAVLVPYLEANNEDGADHSIGTVVLATVRGDVHDIGKNIVGVVLGCNGFRVVDLGVMVPGDTIVRAAQEEHADIVALSGLITPSLDEMVRVAQLMESNGLSHVPLLIGGATTSKKHTALKIQPVHARTVYAPDASTAVVAASRCATDSGFWPEIEAAYSRIRRDQEEEVDEVTTVPLAVARAAPFMLDLARVPAAPAFVGVEYWDDVPLRALIPHIDWRWFFTAYQLVGKHPNRFYPKIFADPTVGDAAHSLFTEAKALLVRIEAERWTRARAVVGLFRCRVDREDIIVMGGLEDVETQQDINLLGPVRVRNGSSSAEFRFGGLRQQTSVDGRFRACSDFLQREGDHVGFLVCTAGDGLSATLQKLRERYLTDEIILAEALADRLSEALAEVCHRHLRSRLWGYETFKCPAYLPDSVYQGIRPAPGYPCQPDLRVSDKYFALLAPERVGISLSSAHMMLPACSVSAMVLGHPQAEYFSLERVDMGQVEEYSSRNEYDLQATKQALVTVLPSE
ncbi:MAG: uncharacterized protein KVP18_000247 [Porospora cf. gigantea A]|uniref:uncharacterized protein n=2 Tax=Porospora cf. gigantea A TaxID=2853593 RepID=UPI00355A86D0|nr:MAG: hypothetical protein KVP18_000247 [Porospora cf. gigantea A]